MAYSCFSRNFVRDRGAKWLDFGGVSGARCSIEKKFDAFFDPLEWLLLRDLFLHVPGDSGEIYMLGNGCLRAQLGCYGAVVFAGVFSVFAKNGVSETWVILFCMKDLLHQKALEVVRRYRRCEVELIEILEQVDAAQLCYQYQCSSTFKYAVDVLGLSEAVALIFISVSRKTRQVPELKEEIKSGNITVSKAQKMTSVLTPENSSKWLDIARNNSTRKLEKEVAAENPKSAVREKVRYVDKGRVELRVGMDEKTLLELRRVQDILSQKKQRPVDLEEAFSELASFFIEKNDPVKKAQRQKARGKLQIPTVKSKCRQSVKERTPIPAAVKHQIYLESNGQCTHINDKGERCQSRRHLEIHHIKKVSENGSNDLENLQLLCAGHHRALHKQ